MAGGRYDMGDDLGEALRIAGTRLLSAVSG